jgi:4-hydroxy-tetrahydrodipicolinate synthase
MFAETNPSPIKYAMSLKGLCEETLRLPLAPPKEITKKKIKEALEKYRDLL